jgi:hypothetical protein
MPIPFSIKAISGSYPDIALNYYEISFLNLIGIFYPSGEPISLQQLCCSPGRLGRLAVVHYSFMGRFLALLLTYRLGWVGLGS